MARVNHLLIVFAYSLQVTAPQATISNGKRRAATRPADWLARVFSGSPELVALQSDKWVSQANAHCAARLLYGAMPIGFRVVRRCHLEDSGSVLFATSVAASTALAGRNP